MIERNYFTDNADLQEQFRDIIDWQEIVEAYEMGYKDAKKYAETEDENLAYAPNNLEEALDFYSSTLDAVGEIAGKTMAPLAQEVDRVGLKFEKGEVTFPDAMKKGYYTVKDAGLQPYAFQRRFGGLGLPSTVVSLLGEIMLRADVSTGAAIASTSIGECLEHFASEEVQKEFVTKLTSGEYTCAMALTEPNYGSDLQNLQTRASQDDDGVWRISGTKRFITHGCGFDGIPSLILTLARTGSKDSGGRGLSFFIVDSKDVEIAGVEHKMGLHSSPTCEVVYEGSKGVLIGEVGEGLIKGAMGMMNSARVAVAIQAMGLAVTAHEEAKKYARERIQFGKPIEELRPVRKMLDKMEREISAMRCLVLEAARSVDLYKWRKQALAEEGRTDREIRKDEQVKTWEKIANLFTPLSRYYLSETCNRIAYDAVQIHGGSGFTEDYDVARVYRDARISPIYEGTTQLQTIAAIGGFTAGMTPNGNVRQYIDQELARFSPSNELLALKEELESLSVVFKEVTDKDTLAFELVESGARFMNGMLMERAASRLSGETQERRLKLCRAYNLDSKAIMAANRIQLEAGVKEEALV